MVALLANVFVGLLLLLASIPDHGLYVVAFTAATTQFSSEAGNETAAGDLVYDFNSGSEDDTGSSGGLLHDEYEPDLIYDGGSEYGGSEYGGSYEYYSNNDGVASGNSKNNDSRNLHASFQRSMIGVVTMICFTYSPDLVIEFIV
jgi:hypothetical protein